MSFEVLCLNVVMFTFFLLSLAFFSFFTSLANVKGITEKIDAEHSVSGYVKVKPVLQQGNLTAKWQFREQRSLFIR